jgi:outer membrane immunogenic protein
LALAGLTLPASAADLGARPIGKAPALAPAPIFNWSGFYIGAGLGGRWTDTSWDTTCLAPGALGTGGCPNDVFVGTTRINNDNPAKFDMSGIRASGYLGYNWQFSSWVFGVEGDWGWADNKETHTGIPGTWSATFGPGVDTATVRDRWDASARARIGFLVTPQALIYATGGASWLDKEISASCGATFPVGWCAVANAQTVSKTYTGWTVGGGIDWMFAPAWVARAEYRFADYGTEDFQFFSNVPIDSFNFGVSQKTHTAYAGVSYLFNWSAPSGPRY